MRQLVLRAWALLTVMVALGAGAHTVTSHGAGDGDAAWLARETQKVVEAISAPHLQPRIALLALIVALLLGAFHALSPGHGKTIVAAYLIGSRGTPRHAAFLGLTVTITHTAGVFLLGFVALYASRYIVPERLFPIMSLISALLVFGMGILLLAQRFPAARRALAAAQARRAGSPATAAFHPLEPAPDGALHPHGPHGPHGTWHAHGGKLHSHLPAGERISWRSLLALGVSGGLVPCPSAMVLLLGAVTINKTGYGMLLVLSFSVGLAITLTCVGLVFIYARNRFRQPGADARWLHLLPLLSAIAITLIGITLCFGALSSLSS